MTGNQIFLSILILIVLVHYICIVLIPKLRTKFFNRYIKLNIFKKYEIIDQDFHDILEKSWFIKQPIIIIINILIIIFIESNNNIIYFALVCICLDYLYTFGIINYSRKKGFIKKYEKY
ncbi:MAG: hypothetical protein LUG12_06245 [Erysipelotrichaceae bacterium]|nr:hypothetical protein [Erysipelotrichaceae bacterium]